MNQKILAVLRGHAVPLGFGLNVFLVMAVMASALLLVHYQYEARRLNMHIDRQMRLRHVLERNMASARAQRQQLTAPARIEELAQKRLGMREATPGTTVFLGN